MKLSYLVRGLPGHPSHPPLTDATIGTYTFAVVAATADVLGISDNAATHGWWLALLAGLLMTIPTAATGFFDWLTLTRGSRLFRTATAHMISMLLATVFFAVAAGAGKGNFDEGNVTAGPYVLTLVGFALLAVGGWIGGTITYVYGMRVLNLVEEPTERAVAPKPTREKEAADR